MWGVVKYEERGDSKHNEATCVRDTKGDVGSWGFPPASFIAGSEVLKGELLEGYALMDLTGPGGPGLLPGVGEMISTHSARVTAVQDKGFSK